VITAGAKQKPGQSRLQLAETNVATFAADSARAGRGAAGHPAHRLEPGGRADLCQPEAVGRPSARVFGSEPCWTRPVPFPAGEAAERGGGQRARLHGRGTRRQRGAAVVERSHRGDRARSVLSPTCATNEGDREEIFRNVRDAAAQVIAAKGATNWAVGLAVERILEAILRDEQAILTVSSLLTEYHGIATCASRCPPSWGARACGRRCRCTSATRNWHCCAARGNPAGERGPAGVLRKATVHYCSMFT